MLLEVLYFEQYSVEHFVREHSISWCQILKSESVVDELFALTVPAYVSGFEECQSIGVASLDNYKDNS